MEKAAIDIKIHYGASLNTREAAIGLCKVISNLKIAIVELDLAGVEFMSRSFADQFYKERQQLREKGISVFLLNAEEEIEKMLEVVGRTQNKTDRENKDIPVTRLSDIKDVNDFLSSTGKTT
ncbi:MAG: STAS domain-containing protein [Bacteroidia bacterium]